MSCDLDVELELIASSLLPSEDLTDDPGFPRIISIVNNDSQRTLHIEVREDYPSQSAVTIELKGNDIGRDVARYHNSKIAEQQNANWLLTGHLLPLLAPEATPGPPDAVALEPKKPPIPHHTLLTSHHLLSSTKRKNLLSLASQLSLTGFSKVGHPGIYYAIGEKEDLEEWTREVKSWNWLALRVRLGIEPVAGEEVSGRGAQDGARGGKGRGDWVELEKISEALDWLRKRGRERILLDTGIGGE